MTLGVNIFYYNKATKRSSLGVIGCSRFTKELVKIKNVSNCIFCNIDKELLKALIRRPASLARAIYWSALVVATFI